MPGSVTAGYVIDLSKGGLFAPLPIREDPQNVHPK